MSKKAPKVFISYSHDNPEHKRWVAELGTHLRQNGVDAVLDQWDLQPGKDVPMFMEEQLRECDFALLVCTERYVEKANSGTGGVGYEKMIVSAALIKDIDVGKFIPIIRQSGSKLVPTFIETKFFIDFSDDEYFETVIDDLLRFLLGEEISKKPPLGVPPTFSSEVTTSTRSVARSKSDLSVEAFQIFSKLVEAYDKGLNLNWGKAGIAKEHDFGKITIDTALSELCKRNFLFYSQVNYTYSLTDDGKHYAKKVGIV
ncbi:MAG: toll/interleukin-1 receptor domain-containing protein [Rhodospirillaceae bacterium]|nr:toll/interleukin-1 receptor domain-containing protein [Rhodospirillaceae bacterium]MBT5563535.1 toll/interleukin-1 receptor domain-containing protein [Rhodospirillaceae bacterium]MBT7137740.1 toll/interleukin-1 receptor domain-containing protein [Rhodospirillaceae bacterium]